MIYTPDTLRPFQVVIAAPISTVVVSPGAASILPKEVWVQILPDVRR
jgi:hypothetical protein